MHGDLAEWLERLTANAEVATVLCSIPASSDTMESEGRQMKQCWIKYRKKNKNPPQKKRKKECIQGTTLIQLKESSILLFWSTFSSVQQALSPSKLPECIPWGNRSSPWISEERDIVLCCAADLQTALRRKSHLCIPFLGIAWPQPQFPHSFVCERFI